MSVLVGVYHHDFVWLRPPEILEHPDQNLTRALDFDLLLLWFFHRLHDPSVGWGLDKRQQRSDGLVAQKIDHGIAMMRPRNPQDGCRAVLGLRGIF